MMTLVAIDDDLQTLALVQAALEQKDLEIITAANALEGLQAVRRHHPQIVLLDLMLPDVGGMEVLDQIVMIDPEADVIMMTAHYSTESAVQAIQKGACDYLEKPISLQRLRKLVGEF